MAQAVHARLLMINGMFDLPDETKAAMTQIRELVTKCAISVVEVVGTVDHDIDSLIDVLKKLQEVKNAACDGIILPHAPKL
jgi:uncharacterized protein Yka (UPF0111/DUF47 family)